MPRRIDSRNPRKRPQLVLREDGIHAETLLPFERDWIEGIEKIERTEEASRSPGDALPAEPQVRVTGGKRDISTRQPVPAIPGAAFAVIAVQIPELVRPVILLRRELAGVQIIPEHYLVVVLQVERHVLGELAFQLEPRAAQVKRI